MSDKSLKEKAISIKGKAYVLVADRINYFNENYPEGSITTTYELLGDMFIVSAYIYPKGAGITSQTFTGHSQAIIGDGMVNKTASLENAETSAVGRALAMMGIGVIDSVASVDEINKATSSNGGAPSNRSATEKQIEWMRSTAARVYNLDNNEEIDQAIESVLTIPVTKVPLTKVKAAVDKIMADKPAPIDLDGIDIDISDKPVDINDIPY